MRTARSALGEAPQGRGQLAALPDRVGIEPDSLELGHALLELALESLRAGADPRELHRSAGGARFGCRLGVTAVVAVEALVSVQDESDVTVVAAERLAAGPAVEGGRDAAPVEQQDRLAAVLRDLAELAEQRRRQRVAGLAAEIDDAHSRQVGADALAEIQPLEARPALGPRRRAPEEGDGTLQRGPLRRHRARVVARVGLLLVRGVVLLVHADEPERAVAVRRSPSALRSRSAPHPTRCALARRAARPRSATSGAPRCGRRSARGSGRSSAARARSRGRGRSRLSPARALPPRPGGRPRSCRCRSRRGAGSDRPRRRAPRSAWPAPRPASASARPAWPRRPARRGRRAAAAPFCAPASAARPAPARARASSRSSRRPRARARRALPAAVLRRSRPAPP